MKLMMEVIIKVFLLLTFLSNIFCDNSGAASTVKLAHILFRHGARTVDAGTIYPTDPYINETYQPYGLGQLTKEGKLQMYTFGQALRGQYGHFLGANYIPHVVEGIASDVDRCKTSLQLVFAGLLPPTESEMFDPSLPWQPIPFSVSPKEDLIFTPGSTCPNYMNLLNIYMSSPEFQNLIQPDLENLKYVADHTGLVMDNYLNAVGVHSVLKAEKEWGLTLPAWTEKVYPKILSDLAYKAFELEVATLDLKKLLAGFFLKKIIKDSKAAISGNQKKMFLYAGHDTNIITIMLSLGFKPDLINYGGHIIFELHDIDNVYGFKIYHRNDILRHDEKNLLILPNCEEFCPLDKFEQLIGVLIPSPDLCYDDVGSSANLDHQRIQFALLIPLVLLLIRL